MSLRERVFISCDHAVENWEEPEKMHSRHRGYCGMVADRRRALIAALRAPLDLTWDFTVTYQETECGSRGCAIGVAHLLWPEEITVYTPFEEIGHFFGMSGVQVIDIFYGYSRVANLVTPEMVADRLEELG